VKRRKKLAVLDFIRQADRDRKPSEYPVVVMREDGSTEWVVMFFIKDTSRFLSDVTYNNDQHPPQVAPQDRP
jgi:hypothetical protein